MKLKHIPGDFIVEEKTSIKKKKQGKFTYFWLKKKNYDTIKALQALARALHLPLKKLGFAGNKDKKAVTTQLCSIPSSFESKLITLKLRDIEIKLYGQGDEPIALGDLEGNHFKITIRNVTRSPKPKSEFINYFGEQRFSKNNEIIGKLLVQKQFEKAVKLMEHPEVIQYLEEHPKNFIGALRKIPKKVLRIYVHSYQSKLWNKRVDKCTTKTFPLIGFDTNIEGPNKKLIEETMKKEKLTRRDFIFPQIKELTSPGTERRVKVQIKNLKIGKLHKGKIIIEFFLTKGAYATECIKALMGRHP